MSKKVDLRNLDFNNAGSWPTPIKLGACGLLMVVIVGLAWYFLVSDKRTQLEDLQRQQASLKQEFEGKQGRAANLEPLKQQLAQMELMLQQMLRQGLPFRHLFSRWL